METPAESGGSEGHGPGRGGTHPSGRRGIHRPGRHWGRRGVLIVLLAAGLTTWWRCEGQPVTGPSSYGGPTSGIWIGASELASRPTSGAAWGALRSEANGSCGTLDLSDQEQDHNVCVMAKALVYARTGRTTYRAEVVAALESIAGMGTYDGRALALGRELAAYVIAADLIDLAGVDSTLDGAFRDRLRELLTTPTPGAAEDLVACHEDRPNNWGTHCGASRAAVAAYLGDTAELDRVARVFRGWLGERSAYAGFSYGDLDWQCDPDRPVGINPTGCTIEGHPVGGVLPDDQRRGGAFSWPPPRVSYVWEGLQGALVQAVILERQGYDAFQWGDRALLRAVRWLHEQADYPAEGDDTWQPHVVNDAYGTSFPAPVPSSPGKNVGWTDWTHPGRPGRRARSGARNTCYHEAPLSTPCERREKTMEEHTTLTEEQAERILRDVEERYGFRPRLVEEFVRSPAATRLARVVREGISDESRESSREEGLEVVLEKQEPLGPDEIEELDERGIGRERLEEIVTFAALKILSTFVDDLAEREAERLGDET